MDMNHKETLKFLALRGNEVQTMHLGLHRTIAVMKALGNPQNSYASVHIAGTNGKGSVASMCESILRQAGLTTGLYTSPHLVRVEERMRIDGTRITPRAFASVASRIRDTEAMLLKKRILDRLLTTFEFLTCCAFLHFADKKIDIAVIEVGLGGKLDSTNVITPNVTIITGIALDHQYLLGNTLTKIAGEKAGIIKGNVPAISGCCLPAPRRVIQKRAREVGAPLMESCDACTVRIKGNNKGRYSFDLKTSVREYRNLRLSLSGEHQVRNASLAVMAIEALSAFPISVGEIRLGLCRTCWAGRLDEYRSRRRTLMDGAHNPEGAQLLREFLDHRKEREVHLVFGAVRDKDIRKIGNALFPIADSIHLTPLVNTRSAVPDDVASMHKSFLPKMRIHKSMKEALNAAWKECSPSGLVVVTGSLYLVGELLPMVRKNSKSNHSWGEI
jgi:dihydrofolate synthase / folylpolyglutamate synthase